jgi:hypothetical protein
MINDVKFGGKSCNSLGGRTPFAIRAHVMNFRHSDMLTALARPLRLHQVLQTFLIAELSTAAEPLPVHTQSEAAHQYAALQTALLALKPRWQRRMPPARPATALCAAAR